MNANKRRGPKWRRYPMVHSAKNVERMRGWGRLEPEAKPEAKKRDEKPQ